VKTAAAGGAAVLIAAACAGGLVLGRHSASPTAAVAQVHPTATAPTPTPDRTPTLRPAPPSAFTPAPAPPSRSTLPPAAAAAAAAADRGPLRVTNFRITTPLRCTQLRGGIGQSWTITVSYDARGLAGQLTSVNYNVDGMPTTSEQFVMPPSGVGSFNLPTTFTASVGAPGTPYTQKFHTILDTPGGGHLELSTSASSSSC
jgi:hypothetical protein